MKRLLILILSSIIFLIGCAYSPVSSETPADNDYETLEKLKQMGYIQD